MKNTFGDSVSVTLFGESHGEAIGGVLDGLAPGIPVSPEKIRLALSERRGEAALSTPRREADKFHILSGVFEGRTTGTPLALIIENRDTKSADYEKTRALPRPGHADFTAQLKFHGFQDYRGGGHFSGRITAPLTALGAIARGALENKGIRIGTHLLTCGAARDRAFAFDPAEDLCLLEKRDFPTLSEKSAEEMRAEILRAKEGSDSVGGILETAVTGVPGGVGEPWFDSVESRLSHMLFSIPAVKGVEFGLGFGFSTLRGSEANDPFITENGQIRTKTNHNGGINGGITNGMPLIFRCVIKPTPSIALEQDTVHMPSCLPEKLILKGRHDPAILHRAKAVVDAAASLVLCDLLALRFGTDFLGAAK